MVPLFWFLYASSNRSAIELIVTIVLILTIGVLATILDFLYTPLIRKSSKKV